MKYFYLISAFIFCMGNTLQAQQLVKDVNSTILNNNSYNSSGIANMKAAGSNIYFLATDGSSGSEPWVTDGTVVGTHILRDVNPGKVSSGARDFTYSNGFVYFVADDGTHGFELWKTDGTAQGTILVKDINTGFFAGGTPNPSAPINLCDVNGVLYFAIQYDPTTGEEALWKTDGTTAGTVLVQNTNFSSGTIIPPANLINYNGLLYYTQGGAGANNLYCINNLGVAELIQLNIAATGLTIVGTTLFYSGATAANGRELWKIEVTNPTTPVLVKDVIAGSGSSIPDLLTNVNGTLFFTATDGVNGTELWKSDGTAAGTIMVKDITTANNNNLNKPLSLTNVNGTLFFTGFTVATAYELWKSDGTEAGTVLVKDIEPGAGTPGGLPNLLVNSNGTLFFIDQLNDLWKSDGTESGTVMVKAFSSITQLTNVSNLPGNAVFYAPTSPTVNSELWITDGTSAGTVQLKNIAVDNPASLYDNPTFPQVAERFASANGQLFFAAENVFNSKYSLYSTFGTDPTTTKLNEYTGTAGQFAGDAVNASGFVYFAFTSSTNGRELWRSNGAIAGTALFKDIVAGAGSSSPQYLTNVNGVVYFTATDGSTGIELWKTDGTAAGTVLVKDINTGSASSTPQQLINFNGTLYFTAISGALGRELWKSDGTAAGTVLVKDIAAGSGNSFNNIASSTEAYFTVMGNELFFAAFTSSTIGTELWKTDGTTAGTVLVKDISTNPSQSSSPHFLLTVGNKLFFVADDFGSGNNDEMWQSDGTTVGTLKVKEINAGNNPSSPSNLINLNGILYFFAFEPSTGYELWKSDGSDPGTVLVKDIEPGAFSSVQAGDIIGTLGVENKNIIQVNGILYFAATTAAFGRELWQSNGTAAGTSLVGDVFAGPQSSDPEQISNGNGDIYFVADNGATGKELFSFKPYVGYLVPPSNTSDSIDLGKENISLSDGTNQIIATIQQTGVSPINHFVKTKLTIDGAATLFNGRTLARKHVDIEPAIGGATATATVTLYFSQADFTQYNVDDNLNADLPTSPGDATGKAALRIIQYHGVGTAPGNYPGAEEIINPSEDSIVWNATGNYWEVSFRVTGFSGFYLSSSAAGPLPVRLVNFNGVLNNDHTVSLQWKVAEQSGIIDYEIQKSSTANNFVSIASVTANALNEFTYDYKDLTVLTEKAFYRIKINEQNGSISYSNIITLNSKANNTIRLYPVPAINYIIIQTKDAVYLNTVATIIDNNGRIIKRQQLTTANQYADISSFAAGTYFVQLADGSVLKFQK